MHAVLNIVTPPYPWYIFRRTFCHMRFFFWNKDKEKDTKCQEGGRENKAEAPRNKNGHTYQGVWPFGIFYYYTIACLTEHLQAYASRGT